MITEEKIKEIRRQLRRGEPEGEIREQLLREGYDAEDLQKVFAPKPYDLRIWLLFFALLVTFSGGILLFKTGNMAALAIAVLLWVAYGLEAKRLS